MALTRPLPYEEFRSIYSRVPRLSVDVLVNTDQGFVLTLREIIPWKGYWHMPGGTLLYGETLDQAVRRSAREEIGVNVEVDRSLGYIEYLDESKVEAFNRTVTLVFLAHVVGGELRGSEEGRNVRVWSQLPEKMIPDQRCFIRSLPWFDQKK